MISNKGGVVKLPNADRAIIAEDKLRDYLLNVDHEHGGSKARLFVSMGYCAAGWEHFQRDIRTQHLSVDVLREADTVYGRQYAISAPICGPNGKTVNLRSIWQIDFGKEVPRLITMYPE